MKFDNKTIKKRTDGRWWVRYYENGKQKSIYGKTQSECLLNLKKSVNQNVKPQQKKITFTPIHWWLTEWYKTYKQPNIKSRTTEINIRKHIIPNLENKDIKKLIANDIQIMINKLPTQNLKNSCFKILKSALKCAQINNMIISNVAEKLDAPTYVRKKGKALTVDEQKMFLNTIKKLECETIFLFQLYSGTRRSEALNLKYDDVDFKNKTIHIFGTKTETSDRVIPLFKNLETVLNCIPINDGKYFWTMNKDTLTHVFKKIMPNHKLHDLRHTFATRCLEAGIPMKIVQKWLGHSDYQTTANIYTSVTSDFEHEMISKINNNSDTHFDTHFDT